jgi:hypothetical protein
VLRRSIINTVRVVLGCGLLCTGIWGLHFYLTDLIPLRELILLGQMMAVLTSLSMIIAGADFLWAFIKSVRGRA